MADEQPQEPMMTFELTAKQFAAIMSGLNTQVIYSIQAMKSLKDQAERKAAEEQDAAADAAANDDVPF